jgi:hypothetical protein
MKRQHLQMQRKPAHAAHAPRSAWRQFLGDARDLALEAQRNAGEVTYAARAAPRYRPLGERLLDLEHLARQVRGAEFPIEGHAVALTCEAATRLAIAFANAGTPELRLLIAPALAASAECLSEALDEQVRAQAREFTRRQMGERED